MNKHKSQLGQFYTTNYKYILQNMTIPNNIKCIVEPFAGNCDLLNFIQDKKNFIIEAYDIEPKNDNVIQRDTLDNPPDYNDKFVLTNPPFLAKNKNKDKKFYIKYKCDDLYKCFIINLINNRCSGGIIIVPLNFICSIRKTDVELRKKFLDVYNIDIINIFEEQVFDDTSYTICSIFFTMNKNTLNTTKVYIYPCNKTLKVIFTEKNYYMVGGEIYNLPINPIYNIQRATKYTKINTTNILLKCIDDNINNQLGFSIVNDDERFVDNTKNLSARSYATLVIDKKMSLEEQEELVVKMNNFIQENRKKYNSLFLSNYRESNSIARKRISFSLAFRICNYILSLS